MIMSLISQRRLEELMKQFSSNHYTASVDCGVHVGVEDNIINEKCNLIMRKNYNCVDLGNVNGCFSENYPQHIVVPVGDKEAEANGSYYTRLVVKGNTARFKCRFPVPVIWWKGKQVCRSGTLAVRTGATYETSMKNPEPKGLGSSEYVGGYGLKLVEGACQTVTNKATNLASACAVMIGGMDPLKHADINILKCLKVSYICDFMIQTRKITEWSSEKANRDKYKQFTILQMPYPETDFFKRYSDEKLIELEKLNEKLVINWDQIEEDAKQELVVLKIEVDKQNETYDFPDETDLGESFCVMSELDALGIDWDTYKDWDLITLTKNYLRLLLHILKKAKGGILLHSINGWDRTPLFISLLRVSLWADGEIHQTVEPIEMAYLILGYDWYLFGHNLKEKFDKDEEIMHFCFNIMAEITSSDFSIDPATSKSDRNSKIMKVREVLLDLYEKEVDNYVKVYV